MDFSRSEFGLRNCLEVPLLATDKDQSRVFGSDRDWLRKNDRLYPMKKQICFVGFADEQLGVLKSLETMTGVKGVWNCTFVLSGPEALTLMAKDPFDVVVADMRLLGMSGPELLQQVGQARPKTLRFILGDVADQELIMNCIGGTHQLLVAGPCQPADAAFRHPAQPRPRCVVVHR